VAHHGANPVGVVSHLCNFKGSDTTLGEGDRGAGNNSTRFFMVIMEAVGTGSNGEDDSKYS
jgi:hypothetical protein